MIVVNDYGTGSRIYRNDSSAEAGDRGTYIVDRPEDAYAVWRKLGVKGRTIVSLSRRFYFIAPDSGMPQPPALRGVNESDFDTGTENGLKTGNFLYLAVSNGIARRLIHIVPDAFFADTLEYARDLTGAVIDKRGIHVPHLGAPRLIASLPLFDAPDERVLLYIDATFLQNNKPEDIAAQLRIRGLRTDCVVLCRALDEDEVTSGQRIGLEKIKGLIGR